MQPNRDSHDSLVVRCAGELQHDEILDMALHVPRDHQPPVNRLADPQPKPGQYCIGKKQWLQHFGGLHGPLMDIAQVRGKARPQLPFSVASGRRARQLRGAVPALHASEHERELRPVFGELR